MPPQARRCAIPLPAESLPSEGHNTPPLVGRDHEVGILRDYLTIALAGHGGLVLIGGEAGIGKTTLAETFCREATEQGALCLIGRCYDLTETPPYGPWVELFGHYRQDDDWPARPVAFAQRGTIGAVASQAALFHETRDFLAAVSARAPVVLLLDDLHWSDPASLELLRSLARTLSDIPVLILATYRADELTRRHPLYALLPTLVREANAFRLDVQRLDTPAIRALVDRRYALPSPDAERLVALLQKRTDGNPFFAGEVARTLEQEQTLTRTAAGWTLGDLALARVPLLLRQVTDGRLARLGEEIQALLTVAAVIGQEVPITLWLAVAETDEGALSDAIERSRDARILDENTGGASVRFTHALIREALYEHAPTIQRWRLHRRAGELLAARTNADPDAVAHHFQQARDARAAEWLVRAGERAERAYAWVTATQRYGTALALLDSTHAEVRLQGWLHYRLARLRRFADPRWSLVALGEAARLAVEAGDDLLEACALYQRGFFLLMVGDFVRGFSTMEAGIAALERHGAEAPPPIIVREPVHAVILRGQLVMWLPFAGRFAEARELGERLLATVMADTPSTVNAPGAPPDTDIRANPGGLFGGLAWVHAYEGRPDAAERAFARDREVARDAGNYNRYGWSAHEALFLVTMPYQADQPARLEQLAAEAEWAWARASTTWADHPPRIARLPLLTLAGHWDEAQSLATAEYATSGSNVGYKVLPFDTLGRIAIARGDTRLGWSLVGEWLPDGPQTPPGTVFYVIATGAQRIAAALALDAGDLLTAREWLEAHDRWLAWSGAVLDQSESQALWAQYHRQAGDVQEASRHARTSLTLATVPRQPLALLAAHRLMGELAIDAGHYPDAVAHLDAALALADACAAPYERALTLLALATLRHATGNTGGMATSLDEARTICIRLNAIPALARADQIALAALSATKPSYPCGLSAREVEVLRLVAEGLTNAQIAERLFLSSRTVNGHLTTIYTKLDVSSRSGAIRFALDHGLR